MGFYKGTPDIIIKNGTIVDGSGNLPYYADLAVKGDVIDYIGDLQGIDAPLVIDAHHKYVTPGFIDPHTHGDFTIWGNPEAHSSVRQGVTTEIMGNCGFSMRNNMEGVPWDPAGDGIDCVYNLPGPEYPKGSMAAVLDKAEKMGCSVNTAWLCGHNALRTIAGLYTTDYTQEQFDTMASFLREAMEAGFIGFSTGLEFIPGIVSRPEEVEKLAMIAAEYDANYSTHMRDEGTYILEAVNEFLNVIRKTGMRGTVSHLNVKYDNGVPNEYLQKGMDMLKHAREVEHLNVLCDMLPNCFAPGGAVAILPPWLYADGWDRAKEILHDPEGRKKVANDLSRYWRFLGAGGWDRLLYVSCSWMPEINGVPFAELVKRAGKEPVDVFLDIFEKCPDIGAARNAGMIGQVFYEQTLIDSVVTDPIYMWMTDSHMSTETGPLPGGMESFMSTTYFFTRYVRDLGVIPIEKALPKVSYVPARHFRLEKRGLLAEGYYADINVFNIHDLKVNATFTEPRRYSTGMDYVIVNGTPVIAEGEHTGERAGRVLRHKYSR